MECLICKRTGQKLFNINLCCGDGQNTIKDDIIEFVGDSIADRLDDKQHVCNICMNMLDDIVKSKYKVLEAILTQNGQKPIPNLGRFWTFIANSYQSKFEQDEYGNQLTPSLTPSTPTIPLSRDPTPLTVVSRIKPYNEKLEKDVERREAVKSELERCQRNMELTSVKSRDKKIDKREKNEMRSKSADIKKARRHIVKTAQSDMVERPQSSASDMSFVSFTEEKKEIDQQPKPLLVYDGDEIIFPVKRTRSVSRCHEQNIHEKQKQNEQKEIKKLFRCPDDRCKDVDFGESLEVFTSHMVLNHCREAYYKCWCCGNEFITKDHLKFHLKTHDTYPVFCAICGVEQKNVSIYQEHIEQHLSSSYKCFLCDTDFLTKKDCNSHIFSNHKRKKSYYRVESKILKSCYYKKPNTRNAQKLPETDTGSKNKQYHSSVLNVSTSRPTLFRERSYAELDYLQRKRVSQPEVDSLVAGDSKPLSLGDDLVYNTQIVEGFTISRRTPATPSSLYRNRDSACSTPFDRLNVPLNEPFKFDIGSLESSSWLSSRRDLESRNTEIADIFGDVSEADFSSVVESNKSVSDDDMDEPVETIDSNSSEVETESHYLDKNGFVSTINFDCDNNSEKS